MSFRPSAIVVHCSATTSGDAEAFRRYHMEQLGWSDIGYHAVILNGYRTSGSRYSRALDGKIEPGRPEDRAGAHCKADDMNAIALGVCLVGDPGQRGRTYPTQRQLSALVHWLAVKCRRYGIAPERITQHSDHEPGKPFCASLNMADVRRRVRVALTGN